MLDRTYAEEPITFCRVFALIHTKNLSKLHFLDSNQSVASAGGGVMHEMYEMIILDMLLIYVRDSEWAFIDI